MQTFILANQKTGVYVCTYVCLCVCMYMSKYCPQHSSKNFDQTFSQFLQLLSLADPKRSVHVWVIRSKVKVMAGSNDLTKKLSSD